MPRKKGTFLIVRRSRGPRKGSVYKRYFTSESHKNAFMERAQRQQAKRRT